MAKRTVETRLEKRGFKAYEELEFTDDFMFGKVMEDLDLCHGVLERLLQRKIGKLVRTDLQKEYKFTADGKPIRMDVFTRTKKEVFDAEVQNLNKKSIKSLQLPRRTRFYQSSVDADYMEKGYPYKRLPDSTILFLCTFDPFGKGLGKYTFREMCVEEAGLYLEDGTTKVFFNSKYKGSDISDDLKIFYEYLDSGRAGDALTERINQAVIKARAIEEWRSIYVKEMVLLMDAREEGREEERKKTERATQEAEAERKRAEAERKKAEAERKRAEEAEARIRELEARLAAFSGSQS